MNSSATLHHVTHLPPGVTFEQALAKLQDHDLLIRLDPELASYEALPVDPENPKAKRYSVTDHMHALPKGLWDTTVKFEANITNTDDGILWVIKAPLGLLQTTTWRVLKTDTLGAEDAGGEETKKGEWSLIEDVQIEANRLVVGTVKSKCESNWRNIHAKYVGHLTGEQPHAKA